jgi:membrane-bound lytic murein transglycosylase B
MTLPAFFRLLASIVLSIGLAVSSVAAAGPEGFLAFYQPLLERLVEEGFDTGRLSTIFGDPRAEPVFSAMSLTLGKKETADLYSRFLSDEQIELAKKFRRQNLKILRQMEKRFHVDKEVVVAILLVESRFGEYTGKHRVVPTLASIALIDSPVNLTELCRGLLEQDPELSPEWLEGRAKRKAAWAYKELTCLLRILERETIDPLEIRGSYAGALGMAQFVPTSYRAFALPKKGLEGWLREKDEAIFSIGNYLMSNGWKKKLSEEKKRQVLWSYNHSEPYVSTILEIARRIR